jgi:hypothetical protein
MQRITLGYIGLGTFLGCWLLQFTLPYLVQDSPMHQMAQITDGAVSSFILLNLIFAVLAFAIVSFSITLHSFVCSLKFFRPRIGDILIQGGHITRQQLELALSLQKMNTGELLVHIGCLTQSELDEALERQRHIPKRLEEILVELRHCSAHDVQWAEERVGLKLGEILVEWGFIRRDELHAALGKLWFGRVLRSR